MRPLFLLSLIFQFDFNNSVRNPWRGEKNNGHYSLPRRVVYESGALAHSLPRRVVYESGALAVRPKRYLASVPTTSYMRPWRVELVRVMIARSRIIAGTYTGSHEKSGEPNWPYCTRLCKNRLARSASCSESPCVGGVLPARKNGSACCYSASALCQISSRPKRKGGLSPTRFLYNSHCGTVKDFGVIGVLQDAATKANIQISRESKSLLRRLDDPQATYGVIREAAHHAQILRKQD